MQKKSRLYNHLNSCLRSIFCIFSSIVLAQAGQEEIPSNFNRGNLEKLSDLKKLSLAKHFILFNDFKKAYFLLNQTSARPKLGDNKVDLIKKHYLAIIYFVNGQNEEALKILSSSEFEASNAYQIICPLKISATMAFYLEHPAPINYDQLKKEIEQCQRYTSLFVGKEHLWLEGLKRLHELKQNENYFAAQLDYIATRPDLVATWIKLGLYTQNPAIVLKNLGRLELSSYLNPDVREVISLAYYRNGNKEEAFNFIEDLATFNAENIKGQLLLDDKKLELAYGHFQLALRQKSDSSNALQALIPLAWLLRDQEKFLKFLTMLPESKDKRSEYLLLHVLSLIGNNKLEEAQKKLNLMNSYSHYRPKVFAYMQNYITLKGIVDGSINENNSLEQFHLKNGSSQACDLGDKLNCWLWEQIFRENISNIKNSLLSDQPIVPKDFSLKKFIDLTISSKSKLVVKDSENHNFLSIDQIELEDLDEDPKDAFMNYFEIREEF